MREFVLFLLLTPLVVGFSFKKALKSAAKQTIRNAISQASSGRSSRGRSSYSRNRSSSPSYSRSVSTRPRYSSNSYNSHSQPTRFSPRQAVYAKPAKTKTKVITAPPKVVKVVDDSYQKQLYDAPDVFDGSY